MRGVCLLAAAAALWAEPRYTAEGRLIFPEDYRQWVFLSSGVGMTYGPAAAAPGAPPLFDNVFVNPESYRSFLETGRWPDKTTFILEIRYSMSEGSINRGGRFQSDISAVEAHVIDRKRFPKGSGFFGFPVTGGAPGKSGGEAGTRCLQCHQPNGAVENTFVQFYPELLRIAEQKGTLRADYRPMTPSPAGLYHVIAEQGWPAGEKELARVRQSDAGAQVLTEGGLGRVASDLAASKRIREAVALLEWTAAAHPRSANALDSLAEAYELAGEKEKAAMAARRTLELLPADASLTADQREAIGAAAKRRLGR